MRGVVERAVRRVLQTFGALIERLGSVGLIQSGVILAAQAFLAVFPLLMAAVALLPPEVGAALAQSLRTRVGVSGSSEEMVQRLVASREELRGSITVLGAIVVLVSATSFTRSLQRVYERSWRLSRQGMRGSLRGLLWLLGFIAYLAVIGAALRFAGTGVPGTVTRTVLVIAGAVVLWWWTPYVLLFGRVRARALLPTGLLTAAATLLLGRVSTVVVPRTIRNNEQQYGTIGAVLAVESWLVVVACTLVFAIVAGAVLAQSPGPLGRLTRGSAEPDLWRTGRTGPRD